MKVYIHEPFFKRSLEETSGFLFYFIWALDKNVFWSQKLSKCGLKHMALRYVEKNSSKKTTTYGGLNFKWPTIVNKPTTTLFTQQMAKSGESSSVWPSLGKYETFRVT